LFATIPLTTMGAMPTYLVERYLPGHDRAWLEAELARLPHGVDGVRYLGSLYVPTDEACLCRFQADDAQRVRDANVLASLPFARIVAVIELGTTHSGHHHGEDTL
jgi:hypothetical protein